MTATEPVDLVFDTFAWIEIFDHGPGGERAHAMLLAKRVGTPVVALAEISHLYATRAPEKRAEAIEAVRDRSATLDLTPDIALAAGATRAKLSAARKGIGLVDCIILETARAHGAKLLTGDLHLKGLDGVEFLK